MKVQRQVFNRKAEENEIEIKLEEMMKRFKKAQDNIIE